MGYDLGEPLPDHSSLTRIRERYGVDVFRRFFDKKVIAHLVPVSEPKQSGKRDVHAFWRKIDQLAAQVGTHLPEKVDAVQIIREGRREL